MTTLAVDFDGCLCDSRSRWTRPEDIPDGPVPGALAAVLGYRARGLDVVVFSCRARSDQGAWAIQAWLALHGFPQLKVTGAKPHAQMYVDDRAWRFTGSNWPSVAEVTAGGPWHRQ